MTQPEFEGKMRAIVEGLERGSNWLSTINGEDVVSVGYAVEENNTTLKHLAEVVRREFDDIRLHLGYPRVSQKTTGNQS